MRTLASTLLLLATAVAAPAQTPSPRHGELPVSIMLCDGTSAPQAPRSRSLTDALTIQPVNLASSNVPTSSTVSDSYLGPSISTTRYTFRLTNSSDREIRSVRWAIVTRDTTTWQEVGRREFESKKKIGVGKSASVKLSPKSAEGRSPWSPGTLTDVFVYRTVTFADGSVWDARYDW